jgi:hypothetical protein
MSKSFLSSFENLDKKNDDLLESLMSQAISEKRKTEEYTSDSDDDWLGEVDDAIDEIINQDTEVDRREQEQDRREQETKTGFKHSTLAMLTTGTHKGVDVEVQYIIPGKAEVEISVTEEVYSEKRLENGDIINNCVILAETGKNKYLGNCKKVTFLKTTEYLPYRDNEIEITRGPLAGMYGFIKTIFRPRIGILLNNAPVTVDINDIFYKDLLLKNGKYFEVTHVKLDETKSYIISGKELGDQYIKTVRLDDIREMMPGFKLGFEQEQVETHSDDESVMIAESEEKSVIGSDSEEDFDIFQDDLDVDLGVDLGVDLDVDTEDQQKSTFRDVERTSVMFTALSTQQKSYIENVKRILNIMSLDESLINNSEIVDQLESVLGNFDSKITKAGENFIVYSSQIDIKMIIACLVVYKLAKEDENFPGFDAYINALYKGGYFTGDVTTSMLAELYEIFPCTELKRTRVDSERVTMFMQCYNRLLQKMLGINLTLRARVEKRVYEPIARKERQYDKRTFILPDQLIPEIKLTDDDLDKRVLWGPEYSKRIPKWKQYITSKAMASKGTTKKVYDYLNENIENSPVLLQRLQKKVVAMLSRREPEFSKAFGKCADPDCIDKIIGKYVKIVLGRDISANDKDTISYYIAVNKFVPEFLADMAKVKSSIQSKKTERLQKIESERKSLMERRSEILKAQSTPKTIEKAVKQETDVDKLQRILVRVFRDKFDTGCRDDDCKFKQVIEKVKRVLSNQEQMLLKKEELEMFRKFATQHSDYKPPTQPPKIPKIILRLKKPTE